MIVVMSILLSAVAGIVSAGYVAEWKRDTLTREMVELSDASLRESISGIMIGHPFPTIPVWSDGGSESTELRDLLPYGGLVVYLSPDCQACVRTVTAVDAAYRMYRSQVSAKSHANAVLVLLHDGGPVVESLPNAAELAVPSFVDVEQRLFREHHVRMNPSHFLIAANGDLLQLGAGERDVEDYLALLESLSTKVTRR